VANHISFIEEENITEHLYEKNTEEKNNGYVVFKNEISPDSWGAEK
jgi:hypothetical protein